MALSLSKDYSFAPNTVIASSEVNTDFDELYNAFIGLEAGTSSMSKLPLDTDPTSALYAATKQYVDRYAIWKRPVLKWVSITTVDVENNTGTANQTTIQFPDGSYRSVTEDTSSTNKYRRFIITATAEFTSGTEDSGLLNGTTETAGNWYAIYAVKSLINSSNFVLVGTTNNPTQVGFSGLNSAFGANSWVYLGSIKNGTGVSSNSDINSFVQVADKTYFTNAVTATTTTDDQTGTQYADTASATSVTYTYAAGMATTQIPAYVLGAIWSVGYNGVANTNLIIRGQSPAPTFRRQNNTAGTVTIFSNIEVAATLGIVASATNATGINIFLNGYVDGVLGCGSSPLVIG